MVGTIFIFFYFCLKLFHSKNLNETNFLFPLKNTEDEKRQDECIDIILSLINSQDKSKETIYEAIICLLELFRDNPAIAGNLIAMIRPIVSENLREILIKNNMSFLTNLTDEVFDKNSKFYDDLIDVIKIHPEFCDYSITLVKDIKEEKNFTQDYFFTYMYNITNIDGMDKVFGHIINSTHNIALFKLFEVKILNGTKYAELYELLKEDIIYPYKDEILQLIYKIIKSGILIPGFQIKDEAIIVETINLLQNITNTIKPYVIENLNEILSQNNMTFLYNLTMEVLNSTFIDDLFGIIKNNTEVLNYTAILVMTIIEGGNFEEDEFLRLTNKILNTKGIDEVFERILNSTHNVALLKLLEVILNGTDYADFFNCLKKEIIYPFKNQFIRLGYGILKAGNNKTQLIMVIKDFFMKNIKSDLMKILREKFKDPKVIAALGKIKFNSNVGDIIKEELIANDKIVDGFFNLIKNEYIINIIANIFANKRNATYILGEVPKMIGGIRDIDKGYIKFILEVTVKVLKRIVSENSINRVVTQRITAHLYTLFFETEIIKYKIREECALSMRKIFFKTYEELNISRENLEVRNSLVKLRYFFLKKLMFDSTKNKNDFLTYENCLEKDFDNSIIENLNFNFTLKPIYVLAMFDDNKAKRNLSDLILLEQYDYWLGYCLPLVIKNDSNKTEICNQEDYGNLLRIFLEIPFNMTNAEVRSFSIKKKEFETKDKIICAINFIIILIPILIQIFLYLYYSISYYRYKKRQIFNQLTINQEEEMKNKKNKYLPFQQNRSFKSKNYKIITPKWYKYLNEYFNLIKNGAELFNNTLKESNINNINGITYIKGLLGLSMLLYIFGHIFFILFNLPFKNLTLTNFNLTVTNPFFFIPLIGLRYSPRIILSCSGYTFIYKYLNFIDQQPKLYMLKFIFRQSYKYLLLLCIILYMRYSIYYFTLILNQFKRPMTEILKFNLELNNKDYFINFFDFLLAYIGDLTFNNKQNIIQYFYIPLNEIFLFLFGVILISLGYKFKFRNDIIILILILLIFVVKILIYVFYVNRQEKHSTLYYYLYDYGGLMLNPIFNLPSFLIGMFFGLINYSIQKGISLYDSDSYQKLLNIDNRESAIDFKEPESNDRQSNLKKITTMKNSKETLSMELLDNYDESNYKNEQLGNTKRSNTLNIVKSKKLENKIESYTNKNIEKNFTIKFDINDNGSLNSKKKEYNEKIEEMPFLILPIKFSKFHHKNEGKFYFKIIITLFVLLTTFISCAHFFFVGAYTLVDEENDNKETTLDKLSFRKVITSPFLNVLYSIDIDIIVFMVNWLFFIIYSKGKTADIYDFFNNNFWSFFLKCYYSFIIISTPVILCVIYQNEIVINFCFSNLLLFSFISLFIILITVILCYSMYEMPLKKIFKSILVKDEIFSDNIIDDNDSDFDLSNN